jgi:malate dehydrogenase
MKISFIGSGGVACNTAFATGLKLGNEITEIVMLDVVEDWAKGKAIDLRQAFILNNTDIKTVGTSDYKHVDGSDVIVITAGVANKGGFSNREALLAKNKEIIEDVATNLKKVVPVDDKQPLIIVVTNPLDLILNHFIKIGGFNKKKTIGSGNWLDVGRLQDFLSRETGVPASKIKTFAVAQHGAKIVYLLSKTTLDGKPISSYNIPKEKIESIVNNAILGSQEIIGLLQRDSTNYGPALSIFTLISSYIKDSKNLLTASVYCNGEYGVKDYTLGCPIILGKNGVEEIKIFDLDNEEQIAYKESYEFVLSLDNN